MHLVRSQPGLMPCPELRLAQDAQGAASSSWVWISSTPAPCADSLAEQPREPDFSLSRADSVWLAAPEVNVSTGSRASRGPLCWATSRSAPHPHLAGTFEPGAHPHGAAAGDRHRPRPALPSKAGKAGIASSSS